MNFKTTNKIISFFTLGIISILMTPLITHAVGEFTVYPSYTHQGNKNWIIQKANPSSTIRDFVTLENLSSEPLSIELSFAEGSIINNDFTTFQVTNNPENQDLGNWFQTETPVITLEPKSQTKVPFSILIPENAPAKTYAGVIYASHTSQSSSPGTIPITTQIGVRTYISVNTPLPAALTQPAQSQPIILYVLATIFVVSILLILFQKKPNPTKLSHTAIIISITILSFQTISSTQAQIMEVEITKGGYLLQGPSQINFQKIEASFEETISAINFRNLEENGFIEIEDLNGGTPFSVSVSATDFTSDNNFIRNHNLFIRNRDDQDTPIQIIEGSTNGIELNPSTDQYAPLSETQTIFDRIDGDEPGKWRIFPSIQLRVPENTKSGIYTNNIVFTII